MGESPVSALRERQRLEMMRTISDVAVDLFTRHGFDAVTIEAVAESAGVSPATVYRRFGSKENLVAWQPDERAGFERILHRLHQGDGILDAALEATGSMPDETFAAVESTGASRLALMASHPGLAAAARVKADSFGAEALAAWNSADPPGSPEERLSREVAVGAVGAAMSAATAAYARGDGPLSECMQRALLALRRL